MEGNWFEVQGQKGKLWVARHKSKNLSLFIIGVSDERIKVDLAFLLPDKDAETLANWILSNIHGKPHK